MIGLAKFTKAFSDKNRVKILSMLSDESQNVGSVANKLNVEENLASHHLRVLHALGLLKNNKKGRQVFYQLNKKKVVTLLRDLQKNDTFREILHEAISEPSEEDFDN